MKIPLYSCFYEVHEKLERTLISDFYFYPYILYSNALYKRLVFNYGKLYWICNKWKLYGWRTVSSQIINQLKSNSEIITANFYTSKCQNKSLYFLNWSLHQHLIFLGIGKCFSNILKFSTKTIAVNLILCETIKEDWCYNEVTLSDLQVLFYLGIYFKAFKKVTSRLLRKSEYHYIYLGPSINYGRLLSGGRVNNFAYGFLRWRSGGCK